MSISCAFKSTVLASLAGGRAWKQLQARRPQTPAVLPRNSSSFSRIKAFQFVVCFWSIYSALKWLFWTIFLVLCLFHGKEQPAPMLPSPEVPPDGYSHDVATETPGETSSEGSTSTVRPSGPTQSSPTAVPERQRCLPFRTSSQELFFFPHFPALPWDRQDFAA